MRTRPVRDPGRLPQAHQGCSFFTKPLHIPLWVVLLQLACSGVVHGADLSPLAGQVTIRRDTYNVPHIFGRTDAACAYGLAWAQCEDNFQQLALNLLAGQGRLAEWAGRSALVSDQLVRRHRVAEVVNENYQSFPAVVRSICEGFAAGVNDYLSVHPSELGKTLGKMRGQDVASFARMVVLIDFVLGRGRYMRQLPRQEDGRGSNMWAVAPKRTDTGQAMLLINPHLSWTGRHYWYEAHLRSEEGYEMAGASFLGMPLPAIGHGRHVAWSHTVNGIRLVDIWEERVQGDPPESYQYGDRRRPVRRLDLRLRYRQEGRMVETARAEFRTHRGPLVRGPGGRWYSIRSSVDEDADFLTGWYHMAKAKDIAQLQEIIRRHRLPSFNLMAADTSGDIYYVYNGKPPIRPVDASPVRPLPGWDPGSEWLGIHQFDELPEMLNPNCGYMQNCNSSPYYTAADDNPTRRPVQRQFVRAGMTMRAHSALRLLAELESCSWERFQEAAFDNRCEAAARLVPELLEALDDARSRAGSVHPDTVRAGDLLRPWDYRASTSSTGMTAFFNWMRHYAEGDGIYRRPFDGDPLRTPEGLADRERALTALAKAAENLKQTFGDVQVPWGNVQVIRRGGREFPLGGGPGSIGCLRTIGSRFQNGRLVASGGDSFVMAVHLTDPIQAVSIHPLGNSDHPSSPHYIQQTELFCREQFKPAWFSDAEIAANTERTYHPGD